MATATQTAQAGTCNVPNRTVFEGDNLDVMRGINDSCVDLIYLDPPFNSNRDYAAPIGSKAAGAGLYTRRTALGPETLDKLSNLSYRIESAVEVADDTRTDLSNVKLAGGVPREYRRSATDLQSRLCKNRPTAVAVYAMHMWAD